MESKPGTISTWKKIALSDATQYLVRFHPVQDLSLCVIYVFVCFFMFCKNNELKLPFLIEWKKKKVPPEL